MLRGKGRYGKFAVKQLCDPYLSASEASFSPFLSVDSMIAWLDYPTRGVINLSGAGANGVEGLKSHVFFATINWEKLLKRQIPPPFKPVASRVDDAFYFDKQFTSKTPKGK